jgi:hypothetical protein
VSVLRAARTLIIFFRENVFFGAPGLSYNQTRCDVAARALNYFLTKPQHSLYKGVRQSFARAAETVVTKAQSCSSASAMQNFDGHPALISCPATPN